MLHPDFVFWSLMGSILVLLPAPWHWRARNIATLSLIFWVALSNLILFVNTIVWADNYKNSAPVWCDLSSRILWVVPIAVSAASLAQMRRLESVASSRQTIVTASQQARRMWGEALLCFGYPLLMLPVSYTVQGHRFDVYEGTGCTPSMFFSWPAITVRFIIPLIVSFASFVYAVLAVRWFLIRRLQFRSILAASNSGLNVSRYLRLIALAISDVTILVFMNAFTLGIALREYTLLPYTSWQSVHTDFGVVSQLVEAVSTPALFNSVVVTFYAAPLYSIVFFAFFGLGEEAISDYAALWRRAQGVLSYLGWKGDRRNSTHLQQLPALGSKVVATSGLPWSTLDQTLSAADDYSGSYDDARALGIPHGRAGIAVKVEHCVV